MEPVQLVADEQKPILLCTENKNPRPLITVPSSMRLRFWVLSLVEVEKGSVRAVLRTPCASPKLGLLLDPDMLPSVTRGPGCQFHSLVVQALLCLLLLEGTIREL